MHNHYPPREALLERGGGASNALLADPSTNDLVLEPLPNGEHAWLRPARQLDRYQLNPERVVIVEQVEVADSDDEPRYVLTDKGRRELAMAQLFDRGPTVAD